MLNKDIIYYDYPLSDYIKNIVINYFEKYRLYDYLINILHKNYLLKTSDSVYESYSYPTSDFMEIETPELVDSGVYKISGLFSNDYNALFCNIFLHVSYKFLDNYLKFNKLNNLHKSNKYHILHTNILLDTESDLSVYPVLYKFSGYFDTIDYKNYPVIYSQLCKKDSDMMERWSDMMERLVESVERSPVFNNHTLYLSPIEYLSFSERNINYQNDFKIVVNIESDDDMNNLFFMLNQSFSGRQGVEISLDSNDFLSHFNILYLNKNLLSYLDSCLSNNKNLVLKFYNCRFDFKFLLTTLNLTTNHNLLILDDTASNSQIIIKYKGDECRNVEIL